jgi:hypothetical protein
MFLDGPISERGIVTDLRPDSRGIIAGLPQYVAGQLYGTGDTVSSSLSWACSD